MDWNHIRAFHATETARSLSAAARQLGLTQPTLSRQVAALEAALGVALFDRVGRKHVLSQIWAELLARIGVMADMVDLVALTASGRVQEISGKVSISATNTYSANILPAMSERIRKEAPLITVAIVVSNELSKPCASARASTSSCARRPQPRLRRRRLRPSARYGSGWQ